MWTSTFEPPDTIDAIADRQAFGRWILQARTDLRWSRAKLAHVVGLHQSTISRLERGLVRYLRFQAVVRLVNTIIDALVNPPPPAWARPFL